MARRLLRLSIVIPVFNVEKYLPDCLDSILSKTNLAYKEKFEIILVDNNSSDKSLKICKEYRKKFPGMIRVSRCEPWGASAVRNLGVKRAKGEYLWFVDSDDYLEKGAVKRIIKRIEKEGEKKQTKKKKKSLDAICISVRRVYEDGKTNVLTAVNPRKKGWKERYIMYGFPPFQNVYRRRFWMKNFKFPEGMIHEDMAILSSVVLYAEKIVCINKVLYNYRQRKNSVLHQVGWNPRSLDIFKALGILYGKFKEKNAILKYYDELEYFFIWNLLIDSAKDFRGFREGKSGKKQTRAMLKKFFPNWVKNKYFREKPLKFKLNCFRGYLGF